MLVDIRRIFFYKYIISVFVLVFALKDIVPGIKYKVFHTCVLRGRNKIYKKGQSIFVLLLFPHCQLQNDLLQHVI